MKNLMMILPIRKGGEDIEVPTRKLKFTKQFLDEHNLFYEELTLFPIRLIERRVGLFKKVKDIEGVGTMELITLDDFEIFDNMLCVTGLSVANSKEELEKRERLR